MTNKQRGVTKEGETADEGGGWREEGMAHETGSGETKRFKKGVAEGFGIRDGR